MGGSSSSGPRGSNRGTRQWYTGDAGIGAGIKLVLELDDAIVDTLADALAERLRPGLAPAHAPTAAWRLLTRRQAHDELGLEVRALLRAERSGELPSYRFGKAVAYRLGDLQAFVDRHRAVAPGPTEVTSAEVIELDPFERARAVRRSVR
jgi:hypothetical protein